jgi:3-oxoacyl-[acyl-carrier-protein] synthase II
MGLISPLGSTKEALWEALAAGRSGIGPLRSVPANSLPTNVAGEALAFTGQIDDFGPLDKDRKKLIRKGLKVMCRETLMGVASAQLALADAGLVETGLDPERSGVVFGSDYMITLPEEFSSSILKCADGGQFDFSRWGTEGLEQMQPLWLLKYLPNMPASHIAIFNDLRGPNNSITHREAAANLAIGEAYRTILRDHADAMLVGATGTRVHPMKAMHAAQTEQLAEGNGDPTKACRPFDLRRRGMVLGEGAGTILLEELGAARARGATIYAELVGAASSTVLDRQGIAQCDRAMANAMRLTLRDAEATPEEVGHINAHGLGSKSRDIQEAQAIHAVFEDRAARVPLVAAKSYFGNLGAGSGMVELISSLMALAHGRLFRVLNFETPDPECPVAAVAADDVSPGESFLSVNTTPQGQAAAVLIRAFGEDR